MTEMITDPLFTTLGRDDALWAVITHAGVIVTPTVTDRTLALEVTQTKGANWHGELRYAPFPVQAGDSLTVTFSARSEMEFPFSVWLGQMNEPWASLVAKENHFGEKDLTSEWQEFTHIWQVITSEKEARLNFAIGRIDTTVEIRGVSLVRA